jgi:hypothetical protein
MNLCRFTVASSAGVRVGLIAEGDIVLDLTHHGVSEMTPLLEREDLADVLRHFGRGSAAGQNLRALVRHRPVDRDRPRRG